MWRAGEAATRGRLGKVVAWTIALGLGGCGLAGLDAYGRPDPCRGPGSVVQAPDGSFSCANTPAKTVLTGELSPNDPKVVARATALANELGEPVAYSDGRTTRTFFPEMT